MRNSFENIKIVLVEPLGSINLGSIARLCSNFGIKDLRLVSPKCDPFDIETKKMALKGMKIIEDATYYSTLLDAVEDCVRVIATCGRIDHGDIPLCSPKNALNWLIESSSNYPVAIVFGREDRGLSNEELLLAQKVISVSTPSNYPSLNLSHAVAIILYELTRSSENYKDNKGDKSYNLSTPKELNNFLDDAKDFLLRIGFLYQHTSSSRMAKIKSLLQRAEVRAEEVSLIRGILRQTKWFIDNKDL